MIVVLHCGAGSLPPLPLHAALEKLLSNACIAAHKSNCAVSAALAAIRTFERSPLANCGIPGSNVCIDGTVESDAAMALSPQNNGDGIGFAAVAAVPLVNILNHTPENLLVLKCASPIMIAHAMLLADTSCNGRGRVGLAGRRSPLILCVS